MIQRRRIRDLDVGDRRRLAAVLVACALAVVLDAWQLGAAAAPRPPIVYASVFAAIWTGIQVLSTWLSTAATVSVTYLASAVSWLAGRVATFLASTGAMFSKVWEGVRVVWRDVLRPALRWIDSHIKRLYDWLHSTFRPVFAFLERIRGRLMDLYRSFVRPVLDTIDFIRAINRVLVTLHIHVLEGLDRVLAAIERRIDGVFSWVLRQLTRVQDVLDRIVDLDGLFQKWALIASLSRYAPAWIRNFWSHQIGPVRGHDGSAERTANYPRRQADVDRDELGAFLDGAGGARTNLIDELGSLVMQTADALPPTSDDTRAVDELELV
jgi:hypothetical protein